MNDKPVRVEAAVKKFGGTTALNGVSFHVNQGELFGIIGADGSGKTTLFRILTSLMIPDSGKVTVLGYDVVHDYKQIRKNVGYMPGRFSLYQDLTVQENLEFFATVFGTTIKANYHLIEAIYSQIEPFKNRRAGKLSGGMKQKLALCCSLIHAPRILFLDEPTTGVDPVSRKEFWQMLERLKSQGITMVVSTPYMDEASLCDRIALIQLGEIMAIQAPDEISHHFTKTLLAVKAPDQFRLLQQLRRFTYTESAFPFGDSIHYTDQRSISAEEITRELAAYLNQFAFQDLVIHPIMPSVEDVFMNLMRLTEKET